VLYPLSYGGSGTPRLAAAPTVIILLTSRTGSLPSVAAAGRVLVVDDDDVIRQLITVNLELEGFDVVSAVDGQDALDKVKDANVQVVTLDVMMPRLDGWETAARLRDDPETAHIKVILLSARAQEADLQRGEKIGVDAYLTKPFDPDELIDTVRRLVAAADDRPA
jgi:CheY-like chemotaxis protein